MEQEETYFVCTIECLINYCAETMSSNNIINVIIGRVLVSTFFAKAFAASSYPSSIPSGDEPEVTGLPVTNNVKK